MLHTKQSRVRSYGYRVVEEAQSALDEALLRHGYASGEVMAADWYLKQVERSQRLYGR